MPPLAAPAGEPSACGVVDSLHDPGEREIVLHYPHRQFLGARVRVVVDALLAHWAGEKLWHWRPEQSPAAWHAAAPRQRSTP